MLRHILLIASLLTAVVVTGAVIDKSQESLKRQQKLAYFADEARIDELVTGVNRSFRSTTNKFPYRFNRYQQQSGLWEKGESRGLCGISKGGGKRGKPV